ncbi:MAG: AIR synthase related protein, partial [Dehalococcoidia bacterium]|nr:AIR synthase related protein [Dehalococcoidia bacterium]
EVTADGLATVLDDGQVRGSVPVGLLTDPPLYRGDSSVKALTGPELDVSGVPLPDYSPAECLLKLLGSQNIASRNWIYRQYDHQVQTNTVIVPGGDAALLRVKGTDKGLAVSTDGNGRYCYLDPFVGGMIAVAEACRNISCTGALPIALTDCLNFGNPERPEIYAQLEKAIEGMAEASRRFDAPVISGNVSLYNESRGEAIYPTPVVGALGITEDVSAHATVGFKSEGDLIVLIGRDSLESDGSDLGGSEYLELIHGQVAGRPRVDLDLETAVQRVCRELISSGVAKSAHDCSDGGLAVALSESAISGGHGVEVTAPVSGRWDAALFGEGQSRIVVTLDPESLADLRDICADENVPWLRLGKVSGADFVFGDLLSVPVSQLAEVHADGLVNALEG